MIKHALLVFMIMVILASQAFGDGGVKVEKKSILVLLVAPIIERNVNKVTLSRGARYGFIEGIHCDIYSADPEYLKTVSDINTFRESESADIISVTEDRAYLVIRDYPLPFERPKEPIEMSVPEHEVGDVAGAWYSLGPEEEIKGEERMRVVIKCVWDPIEGVKQNIEVGSFSLIDDKILFETYDEYVFERVSAKLFYPQIIEKDGKYEVVRPFTPELIERIVEQGLTDLEAFFYEMEIVKDIRKDKPEESKSR
ncbi:MAG: hypothetical protein M1269_08815 [Chloroflexi bacterium]|nr:hypothetical protein [Chloroflexota bacterium]